MSAAPGAHAVFREVFRDEGMGAENSAIGEVAYSRRLIGWSMGPSLDTSLPLAALRMALRQRRPAPGVLHHSDRGCQYASVSYRQVLTEHGCVASMSRRANCYDNSTMEAFWSTLKQELV